MDLMIKFKALAMKAKTDDIHAIFLLEKNVRSNIIKTILRYLPISAPETLKKWKMTIISVKQEYKSTESSYEYRTGSEIIYGGRGAPMDIGKSKNNYDKDGKPKCFNCNIYRHIAKDCQKLKKEKKIRKCYKYNKVRHLAKDYMTGQKMKNRSVQKNSDDKDNDK